MKSMLIILLSAGLALASPIPDAEPRGGWTIGFHKNEICDGWVSPNGVRGSGERGCRPVSGALCMNGSGQGYKLCGYHGMHCDGDSTRIRDDYGQPRAYIYVNGKYETINSYRVIRSDSC